MSPYSKLVKGATKIKVAPPKDKYTVPLLQDLNSPQAAIEILSCLQDRMRNNPTSWPIMFKSLIVLHLLIRENKAFVLNFLNKNGIEFFRPVSKTLGTTKWSQGDLTVLERYAAYLKLRGQEWVRIERYNKLKHRSMGNTGSSSINEEVTGIRLNYVDSIEGLITLLIRNRYAMEDMKNNEIFVYTFRLLVQDLLEFYGQLNEGIIALLESFFELSYRDEERTLDLYKRFVELTEYVVKYLRVGKSLGFDIPVIKHITTKLIKSLEDHLRGQSATTASAQTNDHQKRITSSPARTETPIASSTDGVSKQRSMTEARLEQVREQKRQLQQQLQNTQLLISPSGPAQLNSSPNPFTPQLQTGIGGNTGNSDTFTFEQQLPVLAAATTTTTNTSPVFGGNYSSNVNNTNPFLMTPPLSVSYTNSGVDTSVFNNPAMPASQPAHMLAVNHTNNPFLQDTLHETENAPSPAATTTTTTANFVPVQQQVNVASQTGVTYVPVQVQYTNANPFQQTQVIVDQPVYQSPQYHQQQQQYQQQAQQGQNLINL